MYSKLIIAVLLALPGKILIAQAPCRQMLVGTVLDKHDNSPLAYAHIRTVGGEHHAAADSSGRFVLKNLCAQPYTFVISHVGCAPDTVLMHLKDSVHRHTFYLEHHSDLLKEITLTARKAETETANRQSLQIIDVASKGRNLAESLKEMSGVNSLQTGQSIQKVMIHGLHSSRIATINYGLRQEDQQWNLSHAPNLAPFASKEIEVVKGAASVAEAFGAVGGVVVLKEAPLPYGKGSNGELFAKAQTQGRGGSSGLRYATGLGKKWALQTSLYGELLGDRTAPDYVLSNTGNRTGQATASLGWKLKNLEQKLSYSYFAANWAILRSSHIGNLTDLNLAIEQERPWFIEPFKHRIDEPRQAVNHQLLSWRGKWDINEQHRLHWKGGMQKNNRQEFDVRRGGRSSTAAVDLDLQTFTAKVEHRYQRQKYWESTTGLSLMRQENSNVPGTGFRPILPNYNRRQWGIYTVQKIKPHPWLWEIGLRYDRNESDAFFFDRANTLQKPTFNFNNIAAHLGAQYYVGKGRFWRTHLALMSRSPNVNELLSDGLHQSTATLEIGDPNLKPEQSLNWNLQYRQKTKTLNWQIDAYANYFNRFIFRQPQPEPQLTIRGAFPVFRYRQTNALLTGLDAQWQWKPLPQWHYRANASLLYAQNLSEQKPLILMPPWELQHSLKRSLSQGKGIWQGTYVQIMHRLVARQFRFPRGEDLAPPPAGYQLIDVFVGRQASEKKEQNWSWQLGIQNIFNTSYRSYLNQQRFFADSEGINFSIKFNYKFNYNEN